MARLRWMLHAIDTLNERVGTGVSFLVLVIAGVSFYEVVMRYVFNAPTEWSFELTGFLFLAYVVLGGGYTLLHSAHVNTDILYSRLPPRGRALMDVITAALFFAFAVAFTWQGWRFAWGATMDGQHSGTMWNPPVYIVMWMLPIGGALLLLQGAAKFLRDLLFLLSFRHDRPAHVGEQKMSIEVGNEH